MLHDLKSIMHLDNEVAVVTGAASGIRGEIICPDPELFISAAVVAQPSCQQATRKLRPPKLLSLAVHASLSNIGEPAVPARTEILGGRLPLLDPSTLSPAQKETYEHLEKVWIPWANGIPFQSKLEDGRLIGPFNPILFSPAISSSFLHLQETEQKNTSLTKRVREVVILAVGSVWKSKYELYAHSAVARKAGIPQDAVQMLTTGAQPDDLSDPEKIAQRYALQLSAGHHVDAAVYSAAEHAFGQRGLVEITYLTGIYHIVCALLNAFEIPAPSPRDE